MGNGIEKRSTALKSATTITPNNSAVTALAEQPGRNAWLLKAAPGNTGVVYFSLGGTADATNGIPLSAGEGYAEPLAGSVVWDGSVSVFASVATDKVTVASY